MIFPVHFKEEGSKEPADPIFFILANNGFFLVKEVDLYRACVKVDGVPGLLPHEESVQLKLPTLPKTLVEAAMGFLKAVYSRYQAEGILLLFYSSSEGFRLEVPRQSIYRKRVKYQNLPAPEGFFRLGTWHSHANVAAYHSADDRLDEIEEDGLHIVVGNLDLDSPSFSFSFMVNGRRFLFEKEAVIEGYDRPIPPPPEWLEKVTCVEFRSLQSGDVSRGFGERDTGRGNRR